MHTSSGPPSRDRSDDGEEAERYDARDVDERADSSPSTVPTVRAIFEEHVDHVGHTLRRLGVRSADVPDLTQEVFIVIFRILADYDPSRPIWPWIFGIAYRTAAAYRRKAGREVLDDGALFAERPDSSKDLDRVMGRAEERALVLAALEHVELTRRAVFVMADIDEVPVPEIARALGIELNTAYSRLRLARADFRAAVTRLSARRRTP